MDKQNDRERHGKEDVQLPSSEPREEKNISPTDTPASEERRQKPKADDTPETGPGGE
jgi:hypothetical protein